MNTHSHGQEQASDAEPSANYSDYVKGLIGEADLDIVDTRVDVIRNATNGVAIAVRSDATSETAVNTIVSDERSSAMQFDDPKKQAEFNEIFAKIMGIHNASNGVEPGSVVSNGVAQPPDGVDNGTKEERGQAA